MLGGRDADDRCVELVADKERLIYHLLRMLREYGACRPPGTDAALCLEQFGYTPHGDRARRMLELGEPGRHNGGL